MPLKYSLHPYHYYFARYQKSYIINITRNFFRMNPINNSELNVMEGKHRNPDLHSSLLPLKHRHINLLTMADHSYKISIPNVPIGASTMAIIFLDTYLAPRLQIILFHPCSDSLYLTSPSLRFLPWIALCEYLATLSLTANFVLQIARLVRIESRSALCKARYSRDKKFSDAVVSTF